MRSLLVVFLLSLTVHGQSFTSGNRPPSNSTTPDAPFWSIGTRVDAGILAGLVAADAITTQRGLSMGYREANPLMRPFVSRGAAGQAAGSAIGFGGAVGVAYLLHRTHHYKAERVAMKLMIAGEGGFVANNIVVIR